MKKILLLTGALLLLITIVMLSCTGGTNQPPTVISAPNGSNYDSLVKRGGYLVSAAACDDCHSPKSGDGFSIDPERRFSGHPSNQLVKTPDLSAVKNGFVMFGPGFTSAVGPWGMSFSANITSDSTGLGAWTEDQFFTAIRKGKSKGLVNNRDLLPPMPWMIYKNFSDDDLRAIFAFLKSTKPVKNVVPAPKDFADLK